MGCRSPYARSSRGLDPKARKQHLVIALHRQKRGYIGRQRLPWTGNRVVSREHRPPDGLADRTFSHSCHFVLSGNGVDLADALVEFLLSGSLDKNVEAVIDRKSTRLNSSHSCATRMPSSACKKKKK